MSRMPVRIWADECHPESTVGEYTWQWCPDSTTYMREDIHTAALAEKDVEIERLKEQVNEKEFDMHSRIRAEYDKTVAEAWKAALAAEKEKVRELVERLEWYVKNDEVYLVEGGTSYWVDGKRKAQALIEKYKGGTE